MRTELTTDVDRAAAALREGKLVAFATETVYGLGGNALDPLAVARIFEAKQRPQFDPLIVHLASPEDLPRVVNHVPDLASKLIEHFWPGPLTLVLPKTEAVPDLVTSGLPTVAVRVPDHELARQLIDLAGVPIAAPSANPFGAISPTTASHVEHSLAGRIDMILDGGASRVGVESTILRIDSDQPPTLLRFGGLTQEAIEQVAGPIRVLSAKESGERAMMAPGQLLSHYAPRTPLHIVRDWVAEHPERSGALALQPHPALDRFRSVEVLTADGNLTIAAANFFAALRRLDATGVEQLYAQPFPDTGLGRALNDRLTRAASR